ncbi:MAG: anhydro-N-acetylmuramic acid kinase [Thiobacillaceae bacterium]
MTDRTCEKAEFYLGLMSGTSMDGIDAVLAEFTGTCTKMVANLYLPYPADLRDELFALHESAEDELHRAALAANKLARLYGGTVNELLRSSRANAKAIRAIGCHGQTIRHCPDAGYTLQIGNAALLAELTGITVIADFRSRDIAAGGQGAPLVPAFHAQALGSASRHRVIANIGGIANLTDLPVDGTAKGLDCGPGNMLMDAWIRNCLNQKHDEAGTWAASGQVIPVLLERLLAHPFFAATPPKSAGREQFNLDWLKQHLQGNEPAQDVQATLLELTARTLTDAARRFCNGYQEMYICGGGAHNHALVLRLGTLAHPAIVASTAELGIDPDWMEAIAFAWLARQCMHRRPGNLPQATGAIGARILGAIYPA